MSQSLTPVIRIAHGQLRFMVLACCWLVGLSLCTQILIWSLATFTEMRYAQATTSDITPLVVRAADNQPPAIITATEASWRDASKTAARNTPQRRALSHYDRLFSAGASAARTLGMLAILTLCPLVAVGLVLGTVCGAPRLDRGISALTWAIVLTLLALPLGGWLGLPWQDGALSTYRLLIQEVEIARDSNIGAGFGLPYYARFLLLPGLCLLGFVLLGFRFSGALEGVLPVKASEALDPALEREASNITASSLHSTGRSAGALGRTVDSAEAQQPPPARRPMPPATRVSVSEAPKRLI